MRYQKPVSFPLLMLKGFKNRLNTRAIRLGVNRSWMTRLFIEYGFKNLTDDEISKLAEKDKDSIPHRKLSK